MKLKLVKIGHPVLRKKTKALPLNSLTKKTFRLFLLDMAVSMRRWRGVGLAANQVGKNLQAFVMECRGSGRYPKAPGFRLQAYLNPRIMRYSKKKEMDWEGCLSIPGYRGIVPRSQKVILEAFTPDGRKIRKTFRGFEARVVQHEVDHLNGFFYVDRMMGLGSWTHLDEFNKRFQTRVKDKK